MKTEYDRETGTVTVSVRDLVELVCRGGSIGGRQGVSAADGISAHKNEEDGARDAMTEVPLECEFQAGGITYRVLGRADMIIPGEPDIVEELKTTPSTFVGNNDAIPKAHIAQGVLYAHMWCRGTGAASAAVRITYVPKKEGRRRSFECVFSAQELKAEAEALVGKYAGWASLEISRTMEREASVKAIRFPFGQPREGQTEFMEVVMRAARRRGRALIQAPTGTGKTMAALYPAVKALGVGYTDRIFYLTPKTSTRLAAEEAAGTLAAACRVLRSVTILAKERVCPAAERLRSGEVCSAESCERANGHYDRVGDALWELIAEFGLGRHIGPSDIMRTAEKYKVCPYELSLDVSDMCDIIICDYNYVFDPRVFLRRFFEDAPQSEHKGERYMFLCDEAHDLVDRARNMFSAGISLAEAESALVFAEKESGLHDALSAVCDEMKRLRGLCGEVTRGEDGEANGYYVGREPFSALASLSAKAADECGREAFFLRRSESAEERRRASSLSSFRRTLSDFAASADGFDKRHTAYIEMSGGDTRISHLCLDASGHLSERFGRASSAVLFSATLEPPDYFASVLGLGDCDTVELPSPYSEENLCLLAADKISTRMGDRETTSADIAAMVYALAMAKTGNYICYLPSYKYLETVSRVFCGRYAQGEVDVVVQEKRMTERERERFLSSFSPSPNRSRVGFAVLGGVFSEGVDLPGDRLSGAVIVGVGLPGLSSETNLLRDYYERVCERGYEFAYVFPGMNKVLQAAGRVIRGERDRGVVLLIDDRFATREYTRLFPSHWRGIRYVGDLRSLGVALKTFWNGK